MLVYRERTMTSGALLSARQRRSNTPEYVRGILLEIILPCDALIRLDLAHELKGDCRDRAEPLSFVRARHIVRAETSGIVRTPC